MIKVFEITRYKLKKYTGHDTSVSLPDDILQICERAFDSCNSVREVKLNDCVTSIGTGAFQNCDHLLFIHFPNALQKIDTGAFFNCRSLSEICFDIESMLDTIGRFAFKNCTSVTRIILPPSLKFVGRYAFAYCNNVREIYIPKSAECESNALAYINPFAKIVWYEDASEVYKQESTAIHKQSKDFLVSENRLLKYLGSKKALTTPPNVEIIESNAFDKNCPLESISLSNVKIIDECAFWQSNVSQFKFGESLLSIESHAFYACQGLEHIVFPPSLLKIGSHAFRQCVNLKTVKFVFGIQEIATNAFSNCESINTLSFPHSLKFIGKSAFSGENKLKYVFIPNSINIIEDFAFLGCKNAVFFCEAKEKPAGWSDFWYDKNCKVNWGVSLTEFENATKGFC